MSDYQIKVLTYTQAALALIVVLTGAFVVVLSNVTGHPAVMPEWFSPIAGTVIGFYFRAVMDSKNVKALYTTPPTPPNG